MPEPSIIYLDKPKLKHEDVKKLAEFMKANEPTLKGEEYWELFAYRICDYLAV